MTHITITAESSISSTAAIIQPSLCVCSARLQTRADQIPSSESGRSHTGPLSAAVLSGADGRVCQNSSSTISATQGCLVETGETLSTRLSLC